MRVEETLYLDESGKRAAEASNTLETIREQISKRKYEKLKKLLELTELKGEDNCFSGYYH